MEEWGKVDFLVCRMTIRCSPHHRKKRRKKKKGGGGVVERTMIKEVGEEGRTCAYETLFVLPTT